MSLLGRIAYVLGPQQLAALVSGVVRSGKLLPSRNYKCLRAIERGLLDVFRQSSREPAYLLGWSHYGRRLRAEIDLNLPRIQGVPLSRFTSSRVAHHGHFAVWSFVPRGGVPRPADPGIAQSLNVDFFAGPREVSRFLNLPGERPFIVDHLSRAVQAGLAARGEAVVIGTYPDDMARSLGAGFLFEKRMGADVQEAIGAGTSVVQTEQVVRGHVVSGHGCASPQRTIRIVAWVLRKVKDLS